MEVFNNNSELEPVKDLKAQEVSHPDQEHTNHHNISERLRNTQSGLKHPTWIQAK
jgi:hypothetical protein